MLLRSRILLIGWLIISAILTVVLVKGMIHTISSRKLLQIFSTRNTAEEQHVRELETQLRDANDPYVKERIIREELNMQKPGEIVVGIASATPSASADVQPAEQSSGTLGIISTITTWLKKTFPFLH
jgi:cell division protein FtsB